MAAINSAEDADTASGLRAVRGRICAVRWWAVAIRAEPGSVWPHAREAQTRLLRDRRVGSAGAATEQRRSAHLAAASGLPI
eukprot:2542835-Prymnesium_polylepis.1